MNKPTPFEVTPRARKNIASALRRHPGMQPALIMKPRFEFLDGKGSVETRFEFETFWIAHDSADKFSEWPKVNLCGETISIEARALNRLNGATITVESREVTIAGGKETLELLVVA